MQPDSRIQMIPLSRKRAHSDAGDQPGPSGRPFDSPLEGRGHNIYVSNIAGTVLRSQLTGRSRVDRRQAESLLLGRYCGTLRPQLINAPNNPYDKIFACAWLDHERVIFGTKCNRMLVHNLRTLHQQEVAPPELPPCAHATQHPPLMNPYGACGIHSIRVSPSGALFTSGGADVNQLAVMDAADCAPRKLFVRHQDWVFQTAWVSDHQLLSGGRDGKVVLWSVDLASPGLTGGTAPVKVKEPCKGSKVRDLAHDIASGLTVSLDPGDMGTPALHCFRVAPTTRTLRKLPLRHAEDMYSIALGEGARVCAVGSASDVVLLDPRARPASSEVGRHRHCDAEGLRSLSINGHVVAAGGSCATLSFLDLRAGRWVESASGKGPATLR
eukprot:CAMPEP_0202872480 /NCGR_PEP_ID=MMETSP1391-20130828/21301_1 /ASSEMBLY_ACC=CAM_ASM_000867 /TAXON_ID=1034604 /ORGANISM="Chlamydomonas leiostraca, Strain SAG 11-49" /LENGTH=382 /DNA_ID=CAMNT_0049553527 /DNA_START=210 /DNA_END=1354 /DNA_ORIENTATION=+